MKRHLAVATLALTWLAAAALAQAPSSRPASRPAGRPQQRPIVLGADDKPAYPPPPKGFDKKRDGIPRGKVELLEYESKTVGTKRKLNVYTPPGYSPDKKYPVLYLLHGIGGDEREWLKFCAPDVLLDNLIADGKAEPMILVFPNGRAQPNDRAEGDVFRHMKAFEAFTDDLLKDVIPFVESKYPVKPGRENRALAGFSMGGGQTLNIGLKNLDRFAYLGAFSPAPNTRPPADLVPDPAEASKLKLFLITCGDQDGLIHISQRLHAYLKEKSVPHVWHVNAGGHNGEVWKIDLYHYAQRVFR